VSVAVGRVPVHLRFAHRSCSAKSIGYQYSLVGAVVGVYCTYFSGDVLKR
jgi:hypothetical protein